MDAGTRWLQNERSSIMKNQSNHIASHTHTYYYGETIYVQMPRQIYMNIMLGLMAHTSDVDAMGPGLEIRQADDCLIYNWRHSAILTWQMWINNYTAKMYRLRLFDNRSALRHEHTRMQ